MIYKGTDLNAYQMRAAMWAERSQWERTEPRRLLPVTAAKWERMSGSFTVEEKHQLRAALDGYSICPTTWYLEVDELNEALLRKLEQRLSEGVQ